MSVPACGLEPTYDRVMSIPACGLEPTYEMGVGRLKQRGADMVNSLTLPRAVFARRIILD